MANYSQANRPIQITTPLGADMVLLEAFHGSEALAQAFRFQLDLLVEKTTLDSLNSGGTAGLFDGLLGQKVTVTFAVPGGGTRYFNGIINQLNQGERVRTHQGDYLVRFDAELVPQLWLLKRRVQSRIFQDQAVPDILKQILKTEWQLDIDGLDNLNFQPRTYCVQYRESDFDFVSRLMEEEGIYYYFIHTTTGHQMKIVATSTAVPPDLQPSSTVTFDDSENARDDVSVRVWSKNQQVRACLTTLWDQSFELTGSSASVPFKNLQSKSSIPATLTAGTVKHSLDHSPKQSDGSDRLEIFGYPGGFAKRFDSIDKDRNEKDVGDLVSNDGQRTAQIRMQAEAVRSLASRGGGSCGNFLPGCKFTLSGHFLDGDGTYLLTEVTHEVSIKGTYITGQSASLQYLTKFECIPYDLKYPFRPAQRTPRPRIEGMQTAVVVGQEAPKGQPSDEEIYVDKYGRVKVQFLWDRQGAFSGDTSCWIRVAQLWAGKGWGAFFWPRATDEVVVGFLEGDPDCPLIVGSVYNYSHMPPFDLPKNADVAGIKSVSVGGDPTKDFNALYIYDQKDDEHLQLHGDKNVTLNSEEVSFENQGQGTVRVTGGLLEGGTEQKPTQWSPSQIPNMSWAKNCELVFGESIESIIGVTGDYVIGDYVELIINPLGYAANFGPENAATATVGNAIAAGLGGTFGGAVTVIFGSETSLVYGPKIDIHRGASIEFTGSFKSDDHYTMASRLLGTGVALSSIASMLSASFAPTTAGQRIAEFSSLGANGLLLAGLLAKECQAAWAHQGEKEHEAAQQLKDRIAETAKLNTVEGVANDALTRATSGTTQAGQATALGKRITDLETASNLAGTKFHFIEQNYLLASKHIQLISSVAPGDLQGAPQVCSIFINAQGSGTPVAPNGVLILQGTQIASLNGGPGKMDMIFQAADNCQITVDCAANGAITLQRGSLGTAQKITLAADGSITVDSNAQALNILSKNGKIAIQAGTGEIEVTTSGNVNLTASGAGKVTMTGNGGVTVNGNGGVTINGPAGSSIDMSGGNINLTSLNTKFATEVQLQALALKLDESLDAIANVASALMQEQ